MKKIFAVLFIVGFLAVLVAPLFTASAQVADCCKIRKSFQFEGTWPENTCVTGGTTTGGVCGCTQASSTQTETWGMVCILNTIYRVADLIFAILLAISIILILLAAYTFITAGGAPEKVNKARDYILYALVGLVVAFLARAIPSIVKLLM